jgi:NADH-quinone oxidoreductase subunit N
MSAGFRRDCVRSTSFFEYFLLGQFATVFLLYGIAMLYGADWHYEHKGKIASFLANTLHCQPNDSNSHIVTCHRFWFKVACVPFHKWTPDVYEGAPTAITAFMSVGPKGRRFCSLRKGILVALPDVGQKWS